MESGEKGSAVQRAFGLGHSVLARTAGWTLPSPGGASGSGLNHRQAGARLPLAVPVCSEVPKSEFLVGGRKEHGGDGQHL